MSESDYKNWMCIICGWVYEEEKGDPEEGLAPRHALGRYPRVLGLP